MPNVQIETALRAAMAVGWIGGLAAGVLLTMIEASPAVIALALIIFAGLQVNLLLTRRVVTWVQESLAGSELTPAQRA